MTVMRCGTRQELLRFPLTDVGTYGLLLVATTPHCLGSSQTGVRSQLLDGTGLSDAWLPGQHHHLPTM